MPSDQTLTELLGGRDLAYVILGRINNDRQERNRTFQEIFRAMGDFTPKREGIARGQNVCAVSMPVLDLSAQHINELCSRVFK
jgi:hypothetical protein